MELFIHHEMYHTRIWSFLTELCAIHYLKTLFGIPTLQSECGDPKTENWDKQI